MPLLEPPMHPIDDGGERSARGAGTAGPGHHGRFVRRSRSLTRKQFQERVKESRSLRDAVWFGTSDNEKATDSPIPVLPPAPAAETDGSLRPATVKGTAWN